MIRLSLAYFIDLKSKIDAAAALNPENSKYEVFLAAYDTYWAIDEFLNGAIFSRSLRACRESAMQLRAVLEKHISIDIESEEEKIEIIEIVAIRRAVRIFETILKAELGTFDVFYITPKRGFDTLILTEAGEFLWGEGLLKKAPDAVDDARAAARCLAYELGTAAGFHVARTVERVLIRYWEHQTNLPRPKSKTIGGLVTQMIKEEIGDQKLALALKAFAELHRNPLIHPEVSLSLDEAIEMLGVAQSIVSAMLKTLLSIAPSQNLEEVIGSPEIGPSAI